MGLGKLKRYAVIVALNFNVIVDIHFCLGPFSVLGASGYTFAEATFSQKLPDWIGSHVRAFEFFACVPEIVVPDNLKSAVTKSCRYEPELNTTYADMAQHYGVAIIPARPYKPRDKAMVELGVLLVQRWITARLRRHTFFSLNELNRLIAQLLQDLNNRPFQMFLVRLGHVCSERGGFVKQMAPDVRGNPLPFVKYLHH